MFRVGVVFMSNIYRARLETGDQEISWIREPRVSLNSPAAHSNFCRGPKDVRVPKQNTFKVALEDAIGLPEK